MKRTRKRIVSLLLAVCMVMTMLPTVVFAETGTIQITQQPTPALTAVFYDSPGEISVIASATNGADISYQWVTVYEDGMTDTSPGGSSLSFSPYITPGIYKYYCKLTAEGCPMVISETTTITITKAAYDTQSDTVNVKANQQTTGHVYILPSLPVNDMTYTVDASGSSLIVGTPAVKRDASTEWKWELTFNTSSQPEDTQEKIKLTIPESVGYKSSSFTLTVKAVDKQEVSVTGINGTNHPYSGQPHIGYTGTPNAGAYKGTLNALYTGRGETSYNSTVPPTDAGDYRLTLSVPDEVEDYRGSTSFDFTVGKKEITVEAVNHTMVQGQELPSPDSIFVNYNGFVQGDTSANSISRWAVVKLNVSDSLTAGESLITFETEAELSTAKAKNYTLKHKNGTLTIQPNNYAVTGTMTIGGQTNVNLVSTQSGTGWSWDAVTGTLTLGSGYTGNKKIAIQCDSSDHIDLVLTGDVTMDVTDGWGISVAGSLTIRAGSHTFGVSAVDWDAIQASGGITIESGTVIATGGGNGMATSGDIVITGSANVTATGFTDPDPDPIWSFNGIQAANGNVLINTSGVVNATGGKGGISASGVTIESGTVNVSGGSFALWGNNGVVINGGTVTTNTTGSANGDVSGNLTVNGASASVTVNGDIVNGGNLTVSGGTVTVTGTVAGTTTHTGGTFNGNPPGGVVTTYAVTVNKGIGSGSYAQDATVTITANDPPHGKRFKEWTIQNGGVTLANKQAASTTFTMPAQEVVVTATYEDIPAGVTPVTGVTLNNNSLSLYSNTTSNTANLTANIAPSNATNKTVTWQSGNTDVATVDANGKVTAVGNGTTTVTVTTNDGGHTANCIVTVSTYSSGGDGGSPSDGSSGSDSTDTTTTPEKQPKPETAGKSTKDSDTQGNPDTGSHSFPMLSAITVVVMAVGTFALWRRLRVRM